MQMPPPLPPAKPRRTTLLVLLTLLAVVCVGAMAYQLWSNLGPSLFPQLTAEATSPESHHEEPAPVPLRKLDIEKLAAQYIDRQDYFRQIDTAALAEYDRTNAPTTAWYAEGREAT